MNPSRQIIAQFILDHRSYITEKASKSLGLKSEGKKRFLL